jgi:hypothetical protein
VTYGNINGTWQAFDSYLDYTAAARDAGETNPSSFTATEYDGNFRYEGTPFGYDEFGNLI